MTETLYVDPAHRIPDEDWGAVVRRAEEIAREAAATRTGGAAPIAGPVLDMRGRSNKHSGISGIPTQLLVLHSAECPLMPGYAQSLTEWAITSNVVASWHRFIGPDSRVYMIEDRYAAWHASEANPMSIGWEQAGYARYSRAEWLTPNGLLLMESLAYDMAQVAIRDGIPARWLTDDEVTAVTTYGNRSIKGFCLHRQIDPETRTDPGNGYPYDLLMNKIRAHMGINYQGTTTPEEELVPNESDKVFWPIEGGEKVSLNELLNSIDRKSSAALAAISGLLSVQLPDPSEPGKTYSLADFVVWSATNAKIAAGAAGVAASNTSPAVIAAAVADGAASVDAQAIADKLQVSLKES